MPFLIHTYVHGDDACTGALATLVLDCTSKHDEHNPPSRSKLQAKTVFIVVSCTPVQHVQNGLVLARFSHTELVGQQERVGRAISWEEVACASHGGQCRVHRPQRNLDCCELC